LKTKALGHAASLIDDFDPRYLDSVGDHDSSLPGLLLNLD